MNKSDEEIVNDLVNLYKEAYYWYMLTHKRMLKEEKPPNFLVEDYNSHLQTLSALETIVNYLSIREEGSKKLRAIRDEFYYRDLLSTMERNK